MDYQAMAKSILAAAGGRDNIARAFHCSTRLRLELRDMGKADLKAMRQIKGVAGTNIAGSQLQVIIGTDVGNVFGELRKLGGFGDDSAAPQKEKGGIISVIAGIFTPIISAIIAGGMIKAFLALLVAFSLIDNTSQSYAILSLNGDAPFYFLPFLVGYTSSKKFGTNTVISMSLAAVLLYPTLGTLGGDAGQLAFFGIPVALATYSSSVIPIILTVWLQSYLEKLFDRIWKPIRAIMKPTLTLLVLAPIMLIAIGPLGSWCGGLMAAGLTWINDMVPWLPPVLMGAFSPLIVMTGMHYSLIPLAISQATTLGYITIDLPGMLAANIAQGGAALCVAVKAKSPRLKELAASSGFTAVLGITEPAMYGVNLKLKRPFLAVMIGGAAGGMFAGFSGLRCYAPGAPGLAALPLFIGGDDPIGNLVKALITAAIAFVVSFAAAWLLGFEEEPEDAPVSAPAARSLPGGGIVLGAPVSGKAIPLCEVKDATFAEGILGKGAAILPEEGLISAPADGVVSLLCDTRHAVSLRTDSGAEVLIHIGLDTVKLNGQYYTALVKTGDHVKAGAPLIRFDLAAVKAAGYDTVTPVLVTNTEDFGDVLAVTGEHLKAGDAFIKVFG